MITVNMHYCHLLQLQNLRAVSHQWGALIHARCAEKSHEVPALRTTPCWPSAHIPRAQYKVCTVHQLVSILTLHCIKALLKSMSICDHSKDIWVTCHNTKWELMPFPWLAARRPQDAWSYCPRREPAGSRQSSGSLPQKVRELQVPEWVATVRLTKHKWLGPYENWFYTPAASTAWHLYPWVWAPWPRSMEDARETGSHQATAAAAPSVWPSRSSTPWSGWKWWKRTRMGPKTDTPGTEKSGQNHRTGGSCQQETLEQMMLGS